MSRIQMLIQKLVRPVENIEGNAVEYGLILALVSVVIIASLTTVGGNLINVFTEVAAQLV